MRILSAPLLPLLVTFIPPHVTRAQTTSVVLPFRRTFSLSVSASPIILSLPAQNEPYWLSVALCGAILPYPRFFVSNESGVTLPGPGGVQGSQTGEELNLDEGLITYRAQMSSGGALAIWPSSGAGANWTIDVAAIQDDFPTHRRLSQLPLLGDTSATRALIFSPPFFTPETQEPIFPNYTFQDAIPSVPPIPSSAEPNTTLLLFPTANANATVWLTNSACALTSKLGGVMTTTAARTVYRDSSGWRRQWFVDGLSASTNYTAYVIENNAQVSGPSYLRTKSDSFPCPLAHSIPYCPEVSYAVPLPAPPGSATSYTDDNIPQEIKAVAISSLTNFTRSLRTFPCGRDWYSRLQTCSGCQAAYRKWACSIIFPRCGEPIPEDSLRGAPGSLTSQLAFNDGGNGGDTSPGSDPLPQAALVERKDGASRSPFLPDLGVTCPPLLGWKCPSVLVNANASYGLGFVDSWDGTIEGGGRPGISQDEFGRVWCNG
ncbi:Stretch-activated Ca2+-permeable channel component, partial [Rhizoctonia solani]